MKRPVSWSRDALDDLKDQIAYIARDNPVAARRVAARIRETGDAMADFATGHPGRVPDTYERSVRGLPYILACAIIAKGVEEEIVILRVIHTMRDWREGEWPG